MQKMSAHALVSTDQRKKILAFTLIELLVVIAIIAILAGLLLPVLGKAKEKTKAVACLSNVKQWVYAFYMYGDDNEEYFPYEGNTGDDIDELKNLDAWYNTCTVYAGQQKLKDLYAAGNPPLPGYRSIFTCPTVRKGPSSPPTKDMPYFMYGFNNRLDPNDPAPPAPPAQFRRQDVLRPTDTVSFTENNENNFSSTSGAFTPARHSKRANLGFVDGHAEAVHTNDYFRLSPSEDNAAGEWSKPRRVYWFPYPTAPN